MHLASLRPTQRLLPGFSCGGRGPACATCRGAATGAGVFARGAFAVGDGRRDAFAGEAGVAFAAADAFAGSADASLRAWVGECAVTFAVILPSPFATARAATRTEVAPRPFFF